MHTHLTQIKTYFNIITEKTFKHVSPDLVQKNTTFNIPLKKKKLMEIKTKHTA